jgi:ABC-type nitrate/sulfonate/bicarbonate transport system permease component
MGNWKTDRTTIFLWLIFFLFLWDLAYSVGIRDPSQFPHPFAIFKNLGDVEFLRGLPRMLRYIIFSTVSGGLIGIGVGRLISLSTWLTRNTLRTLRLGQWLPFLILFATPDVYTLSIAASMLCSCYHYLAATSILGLETRDRRNYVAREITLQILLFTLLSQLWVEHWKWFEFAVRFEATQGMAVLTTVVVLVLFVNWVFRSGFELSAEQCGTVLKSFVEVRWKSAGGFLLFAVIFQILWHFVGRVSVPRWLNSPMGVVDVGYQVLQRSETYKDIGVSLLELLGGSVLGGSVAILVLAVVPTGGVIGKVLFFLLPLLNISSTVLWLLSWVAVGWFFPAPGYLAYWHKVIVVGCLIFFPFVQALWGLRDCPLPYRILLAIDYAFPVAFVAMCYGEMYGATAGLGFMMVVATATYQFDKGLAGFMIVVFLLAVLSLTTRSVARTLVLRPSSC